MGHRHSAEVPRAPTSIPLAKVPFLSRISQLEDLHNAVLGAGLNATQLSRAPVTGSLMLSSHEGLALSSARIGGRVALEGVLSENLITFGLGVELRPGSRQWLREVQTGEVAAFRPGDDHDALYAPGSLYATVGLSPERIEERAAQLDIVLDPFALGSGVHARPLARGLLAQFQQEYMRLHADPSVSVSRFNLCGQRLLDAFLLHFGRQLRTRLGPGAPGKRERVVACARAFIHESLSQPLSVEKIATAASTSPRTLHRAFQAILEETPYSYVLKLRLHRIRHVLVSDAELSCSIASIANWWGITELGRFAGYYQELFGELPSETRARCRRLLQSADNYT